MREELIAKTEEFIKKELLKLADFKDNIMRMAEYRIEHSYRVAYICGEIARSEGLDEERAFVAGLLHDIGYSVDYKDKSEYRNHGRVGAEIARPFLQELGYSEKDVNEICYGIAIHVDDKSDFEGERTLLALTIQDADNIDRFDAYRLYEDLHRADYMNLSLAEQKAFTEKMLTGLERLKGVEFATKTSQKMWLEKLDFQIEMYRKLRSQIDHSCRK